MKILESGAFEGVTISYSMLNADSMQPVLDAARARNVGVAVMNPLGGGVIPRNAGYFSFARQELEETTPQAALRFVAAHPEIQLVLAGLASMEELEEDLAAFTPSAVPNRQRVERVKEGLFALEDFCTGCRYCDGCPKGVPTAAIMKSRTSLLFAPEDPYGSRDPKTAENIGLFRNLLFHNGVLLETAENPCIDCGACEKKCTQRLHIREGVADTYRRAKEANATLEARKERLTELFQGKHYQKVGFYPSGGYAETVLAHYREFFGEPPFACLLFNSSPNIYGTYSQGLLVHSPDEIETLKPDAILVNSYRYGEAIEASLAKYRDQGIEILRLHKPQDVPWVY